MFDAAPFEPLDRRGLLHTWLLVAVAAVLVTSAHPPLNVPGAGFIAWAPLLVALRRLRAGSSFLAGFLFGTLNWGLNVFWLGEMATEPGNEPLIFGIYLLAVVVMSTKSGLAAMMLRWLVTRRAAGWAWLVPVVWVGWEFFHEFETPATFPWLTAACGVAQFNAFLQMADLVGSYGVSFSVLLINFGIAAQFMLVGASAKFTGRRALGPAIAGAVALAAGFAYGAVRIGQVNARESQDGPLVGLVQGNVPQEVKVANDPGHISRAFRDHVRLTNDAANQNADLVCWAETMLFGGCTREGYSRFVDLDMATQFYEDGLPKRELFDRFAAADTAYIGPLRGEIRFRTHTPMLIGAITPVPPEEQTDPKKNYSGRTHNAALLFDGEGRYLDSYDKQDLCPGGEYIPHEDNPIFRFVVEGVSKTLQNSVSRVEPGRRSTLFRFDDRRGKPWRFTSSICYEFAFPDCYVRQHRRTDGQYPDFHVNISNEGWFKRSAELDQAVIFCRLRAIESRIPMLHCTNTGVTCGVDATGRVRDLLKVGGKDREVQGLLLTRPAVLKDPGPTLFVALTGRSLAWLSLAMTVGIMALMAVGRRRERRARKAEKAA